MHRVRETLASWMWNGAWRATEGRAVLGRKIHIGRAPRVDDSLMTPDRGARVLYITEMKVCPAERAVERKGKPAPGHASYGHRRAFPTGREIPVGVVKARRVRSEGEQRRSGATPPAGTYRGAESTAVHIIPAVTRPENPAAHRKVTA